MHWSVAIVAAVIFMAGMTDSKPVAQKKGPPPPHDKAVEGGSDDEKEGTNLPYDRYLREVVMALEEDPEFRKKLEESNVSDIKDGSVAKHIELVGHQVRTKLDEIKRREIYRLQELRRLQMRSMQGTKVLHYIAYHGGVGGIEVPAHLDVKNPHSFEMKDLETLIKQTTTDLEQLDEQRKEEFKEYEMEKEYEKRDKLNHLSEEERKKEETRLEDIKKQHAEHPKMHHPGSKDQFEEVWEKKDHLEDQEFNPKTFFKLHDIEDDGFWGIEEVEAVLQSELDKVYNGNTPGTDPMERFEEMNRMREHIFTEMDKDKDARISQAEFLKYTGPHGDNEEFKKDEGWKTVDEDQLFTDDEYQKFVEEHHAQPGLVNQPPEHIDPSVMQMNQGQVPPGHMPQQGQNLQYQGQPQAHDFQQQQQQFAQQQQILQHQQQQFAQQQVVQQQLAEQHAQMQQHHQQQQQQQLHLQQQQQMLQQPQMGQQLNQQQAQQQQGQVPNQGQQQQVQGQVPVQHQQQQVQGQVPVQNQQQQGQVPVQQQQVPVQNQQPVQAQQPVQGQQPVQDQQAQQPIQNQQQPIQGQQQQQQQQAQPVQGQA
ncbi:nucleobindin-2-like isoform X3 [Haliotis rufescens]|uniref:nucleobindin-2-like isoform X3 n=1 Tax=Haliotis rufescens TaxID=6454 RepID=UPI001EB06C3C|nr:nucleobindin-2-like isoform X3 [Haliotis rufescens]